MGGDTDIINLTSTSTSLNGLGGTDGSIDGLEEINASTAAAGVTIDLNGQTEDFTVTGSGNDDVITTGSGTDNVDATNEYNHILIELFLFPNGRNRHTE